DRRGDERQLPAPVPRAMSADPSSMAIDGRRLALRGLVVAVLASPFTARLAGIGTAHAEDPRIALLEAVRLDDVDTVKRLLAASVSPNLREKAHGPAIVMAAKLDSFASLAELARAPEIGRASCRERAQSAEC